MQHDPYRSRARGQLIMGMVMFAILVLVYLFKQTFQHWRGF